MDGTAFFPKTDDTYDLGKAAAQWKDLYIDGVANIDSLVADTVDINGGTIDGTTIGGTTPSAVTATNITATGTINFSGATLSDAGTVTTADINGGTIDGTTIGGTTPAAATFTTLTANGNVTLGDAASDTITFTGDIASNVLPSTDDTYDLGGVGAEWKDLYIDGTANIDSLVADTVDINAGTIDGTTIGGNSAAAGTFTNVTATGTVNFNGATVSNGGSVTTIDINGGTVDGVVIGGASAGAGTFTTLTVNTSSTIDLSNNTSSGDLAVADGGTGASTAYGALENLLLLDTEDTGSYTAGILVPAGTTAQRPATPDGRQIRYNTTDGAFEGYDGSSWVPVGGGGKYYGENGTVGIGSGDIFRSHEATLNTDVTIPSGENAYAAGPLTVASGVTLTVNGNLVVL